MPLPPWRSPLSRALHRNRSLPYARYLQLATVRSDGRPANRTVVFRGFLEDSSQLQFVTDGRSDKVEQIVSQPWGAICWYFPKTREQFRLSGPLTLVQADHPDTTLVQARQSLWQTLSDAARSQFTWPYPGQPRAAAIEFTTQPDPLLPPASFCLLLLDPIEVDQLELRGEPQNRWLYRLEGEAWTVQEINP